MREPDSTPIPIVVKVGGSLFDLPDLGNRLGRWLEHSASSPVILVPGGGPTAEVIRGLDTCQGLGEEKAHWLALRAVTLNAWFLTTLLPNAQVIDNPETFQGQGRVAVLDGHAFALRDEGRPGHLPHCWSVTTDSLAARVALTTGAHRLVLLKSVTIPGNMEWQEAGRRGLVDTGFAGVLEAAPVPLDIQVVNLRQWQPFIKEVNSEMISS